MKFRILLCLLFLGLAVRGFAGLNADSGELIWKDLVLVSAEFGLVDVGEDGTVHFKPADKIPLVPGQAYGWRLRLRTKREIVALREELQLPVAPKTWNSAIPNADFKVSADGRTGITEADAMPVDGVLMNVWQVAEGDPAGTHVIRLYFERKLVRTFTFEVVAK